MLTHTLIQGNMALVSSVKILMALFLCVWLGGVLYATGVLSSLYTAPSQLSAEPPLHNYTLSHLRPRVSSIKHKGSYPELRKVQQDDELGAELLSEVLLEAAEHPMEKGERPEWREHVGVGRREDISRQRPRQALRGVVDVPPTRPPPTLISRGPGVDVTCDTRGNLGPCSVVNQITPGTDWIKDRWQAASDMGGTAIPGHHWVEMDFHHKHFFSSVTLDWEAAFASAYRIEGSNDDGADRQWTVLYDGTLPASDQIDGQRTSTEYGQSPGVKTKMPLHVVHTVQLQMSRPAQQGLGLALSEAASTSFRRLRVYIVKPGRGWGVSLWQLDVLGVRDASR